MTPVVTVCIVSYNCRELLLRCLASLRTTTVAVETIVFDNASADGSADAVTSAFPEATVLRSRENLGFAAGCNGAAARARGQYVLLLNPDAEVEVGCLEALVAAAEAHPRAGLIGGRILTSTGETDPESCWGLPSLWSAACFASGMSWLRPTSSLFNPEALPGFDRAQDREVPMVSGCLMFVPVEAWRALGGLDETFFLYGEDADINRRAHLLGYHPRIAAQARLTHVGSASSSSTATKIEMLYRGKCTYYRRAYGLARGFLGCQLLVAGVGLRGALLRRKQGEGELGRAYATAFRERSTWSRGWPT
ncbi:MAG: glycosyltransferase [Frankiales bacterium]|nr:glycosyltransferase [Frankiales bacterium]